MWLIEYCSERERERERERENGGKMKRNGVPERTLSSREMGI
jgi:hypothetical protein